MIGMGSTILHDLHVDINAHRVVKLVLQHAVALFRLEFHGSVFASLLIPLWLCVHIHYLFRQNRKAVDVIMES